MEEITKTSTPTGLSAPRWAPTGAFSRSLEVGRHRCDSSGTTGGVVGSGFQLSQAGHRKSGPIPPRPVTSGASRRACRACRLCRLDPLSAGLVVQLEDGMEDHATAILKLDLSRHSNKVSNKGPNTTRPYLCSSQLLIRMFTKTSKYTIVSTHFLASNEPT